MNARLCLSPLSYRLKSTPIRSQHRLIALRCVSSTSSLSADAAAASRDEKLFATPKVEEVFTKMTKLERDDLAIVADLVNEKLGLQVTEFDKYGFGGGATAGAGGASAEGGAGDVAAVEEKTAFDLKLVSFDAKTKIKVIKEVRTMAGLGLKEAKEAVEGAPRTIMKEIKKDQAEELAKKLEELGATVEIV